MGPATVVTLLGVAIIVAAIDEDLEALVTGGEPRSRKPSHSLAGVGYKLLPGTRGW